MAPRLTTATECKTFAFDCLKQAAKDERDGYRKAADFMRERAAIALRVAAYLINKEKTS
jgi:hypothetical protein